MNGVKATVPVANDNTYLVKNDVEATSNDNTIEDRTGMVQESLGFIPDDKEVEWKLVSHANNRGRRRGRVTLLMKGHISIGKA